MWRCNVARTIAALLLSVLRTRTIAALSWLTIFLSLIIVVTWTIAIALLTIFPLWTLLRCTALKSGTKAFGTEATFLLILIAIIAPLIIRTCLLVNTWTW